MNIYSIELRYLFRTQGVSGGGGCCLIGKVSLILIFRYVGC